MLFMLFVLAKFSRKKKIKKSKITPDNVIHYTSPLQTLILWHFVYHQSIFSIFMENIGQVSCVKLPNLTVLCKKYFAHLVQVKNWLYNGFTLTFLLFLTDLTFLKQMSIFSTKFNHHWKCRGQKEDFQTVWQNQCLVLTRSSLLQTLEGKKKISRLSDKTNVWS